VAPGTRPVKKKEKPLRKKREEKIVVPLQKMGPFHMFGIKGGITNFSGKEQVSPRPQTEGKKVQKQKKGYRTGGWGGKHPGASLWGLILAAPSNQKHVVF